MDISISPEEYLRNNIRDHDIKSVIDVGTGHSGIFDYGNFQSIELSHKACLDVFSIRPDMDKSWQKIIASATHIPLKDNCFDHVQSTEMIEHIKQNSHRMVLRELKRITKKCVFLTATGLGAHIGEEQIRCESENPYQKYICMLSKELLEDEGYIILLYVKKEIINDEKIKLWKKYVPDSEPIREHIKAFYNKINPYVRGVLVNE